MDGHVQLEGDLAGRPRPSVDLLLSSAAEAYGEHLIAVILTGSGSDGAAGAVDVKEAGGVVIIQNPETAQYPSMPQSLPPTAVDHVAELEEIGRLLYNVLRGVAREQARLMRLIEFAPLNVMVLSGPSLVVESYSSGYARLFDGRDVRGHALDEIFQGEETYEFVETVRQAYARQETVTTEPMPMRLGGAGDGASAGRFVHTVVPVQDNDNQTSAVIVYSEPAAA